MNRFLLIITSLLFIQLGYSQTITLQPGPVDGQDARVWDYDPDVNRGHFPSIPISGWTHSGTAGINRSLINFDLKSLPQGAIIDSAFLSLYFDPTNPGLNMMHSGDNAFYIRRILDSWGDRTVTWNNQPPSTIVNQIVIPASSSGSQNLIDIDVTRLLKDMRYASALYGFMLQLDDETPFNAWIFASSNHPDSSIRPKLVMHYHIDNCINLRPNSTTGQDVQIWNNAQPGSRGHSPSNTIYRWTNGGNVGIKRSLIAFNLDTLPANSTLTRASLSLYHNPDDPDVGGGHKTPNEMVLQRATGSWNENTVTWASQPRASTQNEIIFPSSQTSTQDYLDIDVTALVQDMMTTTNFGFKLRLVDEDELGALIFAASNHPADSLRPMLQLCYDINSSSTPSLEIDQISVFPNPAKEKVTISSELDVAASISIVNNLGQTIWEGTSPPGKTNLDVSEWSRGFYYLNGNHKGRSFSKAMILK